MDSSAENAGASAYRAGLVCVVLGGLGIVGGCGIFPIFMGGGVFVFVGGGLFVFIGICLLLDSRKGPIQRLQETRRTFVSGILLVIAGALTLAVTAFALLVIAVGPMLVTIRDSPSHGEERSSIPMLISATSVIVATIIFGSGIRKIVKSRIELNPLSRSRSSLLPRL